MLAARFEMSGDRTVHDREGIVLAVLPIENHHLDPARVPRRGACRERSVCWPALRLDCCRVLCTAAPGTTRQALGQNALEDAHAAPLRPSRDARLRCSAGARHRAKPYADLVDRSCPVAARRLPNDPHAWIPWRVL